MSPIAGAVSGIIAYAVNKDLDNVSGYHAWQWLFIIEGGLTMFFGLLIIIFLPGLPDTTAKNGHFLFRNVQERAIIARRSRSGLFLLPTPSAIQS
jgi:MFS family permease